MWTLKCEGTAAQSGREGSVQMDSHQACISHQGFWTSMPINVIFWWVGTRLNHSGRQKQQKQIEAVFTTSNKFRGGEKSNSNKTSLNLDSLSAHIRFEVVHQLTQSVGSSSSRSDVDVQRSFFYPLYCQHLMLRIAQASATVTTTTDADRSTMTLVRSVSQRQPFTPELLTAVL